MTSWDGPIKKRKQNHIDVCLRENVRYTMSTGLERYHFTHNALPDLNFQDISTETELLGKKISFPLIISGMTGGPERSRIINRNLAIAAEECGVALGVGSQRIALENPRARSSFQVRRLAPTIPLLANLGAVQLNKGYGVDECRTVVESIEADALVLHLNPLQEVIQGGDTDYKGLLQKIKRVINDLEYPVIVKEVGFGISHKVGTSLEKAGVYAIDCSGSGGTSWAAVEGKMAPQHSMNSHLGEQFRDWGISTVDAILQNRNRTSKLIGGGGIRSGLDVAKTLALGADYSSIAGLLLRSAMKSSESVTKQLEEIKLGLKTAMFGIGAQTLLQLRNTKELVRLDRQ